MRTLALALVALALIPTATALDVLPSEARFGPNEGRLIVRSARGSVEVRTEPSILVAGATPGAEPDEFAATPRDLATDRTWRGLDGIVEIVLRREDPRAPVDIIVEDGAGAGAWIEWPAEARETPVHGSLAIPVLVLMAVAWRRRA